MKQGYFVGSIVLVLQKKKYMLLMIYFHLCLPVTRANFLFTASID